MKLGGEVRSSDMRLTVGRDLAVVSNFEVGENAGSDGRPLVVQIRATNLFRNEGGEWKMIGHHTDILPLLQK
jgi:ketosteroid isomerase-like protein